MVSRHSVAANLASPTQILGVILGAARFPLSPSVDSPKLGRAFSRSKADIAKYLTGICDEVLDCFDKGSLPNQLCLKIASFLEERPLATDLFVYYVGHGGFLSRQEYFLACRATRDDLKRATGLKFADLADTITASFRNRRVYLVLDCCFASSAVDSFQGASDDLIERQSERLPLGIALLNASSRDEAALVPAGASRTMFSDSLIQVLRDGIPQCEQLLSLRDIGKAVSELILTKYRNNAVRPQVHSPRQRNGDVADFKLFPNPGFVEKARKESKPETGGFVTAPQIAKLYRFPPELDGAGQCIGIIHLGGMYRSSDLEAYCSELRIRLPRVTVVPTSDAKVGRTGRYDSGAHHLTVSMQVCCGVAPAAQQTIYLGSNTSLGFTDAIGAAVVDETNNPSVLLVAWGSPESSWTQETMLAMNRVILAANLRGITVCCATGDFIGAEGLSDNRAHLCFPASSPYALACGGTSLIVESGLRIDEVAWAPGGSGFSDVFSAPDWQAQVIAEQSSDSNRAKIGRGVPDVSAHANPEHGYLTYSNGHWAPVGGTSMSAALWAGLIALINQGVGRRVAFSHELLYRHFGPAGTLNEIAGTNEKGPKAANSAGLRWHPCTGWGTPDGTALLLATKLFHRFGMRP